MEYIGKLAKFSLLISIATIFIKSWTLFGTPLKITDIFLLISFFSVIVLVATGNLSIKPYWKYFRYIGVFFLIILIGTFFSILLFKNVPYISILESYFRIIASSIVILEILIFSNEDPRFIEHVILSFLPSSIVIPIAYGFPQLLANGFLLDSSNFRFAGLFNDPNYYANYTIIPIMIFLLFFLRERKLLIKVLLFFVFSLSLGFFVWSGSRSGWLGLIIALLLYIIFTIISKGYKKALFASVSIIIALGIGIVLTPTVAHKQIQDRVQVFVPPQTTSVEEDNEIIPSITLTQGQDRMTIWQQAYIYILKNPIGYGPGYIDIISIKDKGPHTAAHNSFLELLLIGGLPLLIFFLYLTVKYRSTFKYIYRKGNYFLLSIIMGCLASAFFIDSFQSRWLWVLIALIIAVRDIPVSLFSAKPTAQPTDMTKS